MSDAPRSSTARSVAAAGADDEDEWEYDYSTTETETYYLTVELSYPEFKGTATRNPHHSRGGYYKKWLEEPRGATEATPAPARARSAKPNPNPRGGSIRGDETTTPSNPAHATLPADTGDDDDMSAIHPSLRGEVGADADVDPAVAETAEAAAAATAGDPANESEDEQDEPEQDEQDRHGDEDEDDLEPVSDIQILDLHSQHPVISYRGHVFEGEWSEVVGTEVILASHHEDDPAQLPALRHLPGGVDLLGASASRIMTKRKTLHPKKAAKDSLAPIKKEWNINIPVGKNKHGERAQQASFLERLIALKIRRGDEDKVTVYAKDGVGKNFHDDRDPDFRPRRKRVKIRHGDGDDEEDGGGAASSSRVRGVLSGHHNQAPGAGLQADDDADVLSVPTPRRWSDLGTARGAEGEEEEDGSVDGDEDDDDGDDDDDDDDDDDEDEEEEEEEEIGHETDDDIIEDDEDDGGSADEFGDTTMQGG